MNFTPLQKDQIKKTKILIVDDLPENLQVLGSTLREYGFQIAFAVNGKQALSVATAKLPNLILLDMSMPEMDGLTVCRKLKENPLTKSIPVMFLTARTESENIMKALKTGAIDYVVKPFVTTELINRITVHLGLDKLDGGQKVYEKLDIAEVISALESKYMQKWNETKTGMFIDEIIAFSESLKDLGEKNGNKVILDYGEDLFENANRLNIEKMTKILEQYPLMIQKLGKP
ncbi:MAG: response regulator [Bacillota bacterium]